MDQTYYTTEEACEMLSVTETTLRKYRKQKKIREVAGTGGRVLLIAEDVDELYERSADKHRTPRAEDELRQRVHRLEEQMSMVRHIPLFENTRDPLPRGRLGLEREATKALLKEVTWSWEQVLGVASFVNRMCPEEVSILLEDFGPGAVAPWVDVLTRMKERVLDQAGPDGHDFTTMRSLINRSLMHLTNLVFYRSRLDPKRISQTSSEVLEKLIDPSRDLDRLLLNAVLHVARAA